MPKNILVLFSDQFRFDAIAAHGNPCIRTPNLDRLVSRGTTFTRAYTPSPVCIAARCSLHYGAYPTHTQCYANHPMPPEDTLSYVHLLTGAGYTAHSIGKCHFHPDPYALRGYDSREYQEETSFRDLSRETYIRTLIDHGYDYAIEPNGVRSEMYYIPQPSRLPQELHPTQWIGDRSIDFLRRQTPDKPWYLFSSFIHPHPPFAPPSPWHTLYRAADVPPPFLPEGYENLQLMINKLQNRYKYRDTGNDLNLLRMMKAYYYACVSFVDYQIGRILDTLEQTGQLENTVIVFTADHGELLGDYNCFGKRSMHNAAARIPLIVCGDEFTGGGTCDTPVSLVDLAPTLVRIAGGSQPECPFDGEDLGSILRGQSRRKGVYSFFAANGEIGRIPAGKALGDLPDEEARLFACMNMMYAEREFKYVYSAPENREWLFDLTKSENDAEDLSQNEEYRPQLDRMRKHLIDFLRKEQHTALLDGEQFNPLIRVEMPADPDVGLIRQDFRPSYFDFDVLRPYLSPSEHSK